MQLMFQSMNMNSQPTKPSSSVVIDNNNEVDFFNIESNSNNTSTVQNQSSGIDFFADLTTPAVSTSPPVPAVSSPQKQQAVNFNTMSYNFATTNVGKGSAGDNFLGQQFGGFNTSANVGKTGGEFNWNAGSLSPSKQTETPNVAFNFNPTPSSSADPNNYSTLQGLFATNAMGATQTTPFVQQQQQPTITTTQ